MKQEQLRQAQAFDASHLWHPYSAPPASDAKQSLLIEEAQGVYLTLADGTRVIDAMSSWWCVIHGYNHPAINNAIEQQLERMAHVMFGGLTHQPAIELGEKLLAITPKSLQHIFYADSGSVAVEVAMKMAVQYQYALGRKSKHKFLTIRSGYHGDTWKAMSVSDPETGMHHLFTGAMQTEFFASQPPIRFDQPWTEDAQANGLQSLSDQLEANSESIAAVVLEPVVQGAGGMYFYHPEYLNACRKLCDEHDVLLIFDEIATGFGRTGEMFATNHCTIEPDILCLGKAITGGYLSFAATLCSDKMADGIRYGEPGVFMHGPTFMANPLACSAAIASLDLLAANDWQNSVKQIEAKMREELSVASELKSVREVRALGAIGVIEMEQTIDPRIAQSLCAELGVWLRPFGHNIYCMPPYIINRAELSQITAAMLQLADLISSGLFPAACGVKWEDE